MVSKLKTGFGHGGLIARTLKNHETDHKLIPVSIQDEEQKWMTLALLEAMKGVGWASPNPSVGCLLVINGNVIARGFTQNFGGKHAERMAFDSLLGEVNWDQMNGIHAYVTLEPCTHYGKQPPCVDLLLHPSVEKVVVGCVDPDPRVSGGGIRMLQNAGKLVNVGVLELEVQAWHYPFLHQRKTLRPLWIAKWAENQDGLLADAQGNSKWISGEASRAYTHWLRQKYDAILVGAGTWIKDQPRLTVRDCAEPHRRNPIILIHDPKSKVDPSTLVPGVKLYQHETMEDLVSAVENTDFGFQLQSVFCEGGARTLNELIRLKKINLVHRFIGQKSFNKDQESSPHRIQGLDLAESEGWKCSTLCELGNDHLQEWINCF